MLRFCEHRSSARHRGIAWNLTFEEWWAIWQPHWALRGKRRNQLVMARLGDTGPYAVGNVKIITARENRLERRELRGTENAASKLAAGCVGRVRDMLKAGCLQREIADYFGVTQTAISHIKLGKAWAHV